MTSCRPLRGASDRETHRPCVSSPLLLGVADISAALPLVPNDSRSLYSGTDQDLAALVLTGELTVVFIFLCRANCTAFSLFCFGI
jgi:hypothetical protein